MASDPSPSASQHPGDRKVYGDPDTCGVIDAPFASECDAPTVVTDQEIIESLDIVYEYGYCEEHQDFPEGDGDG